MRISIPVVLLTSLAFATGGPAAADQIVQEGSLSGPGAPQYQDLVLDQFDPMGGAHELNFVQIDLVTSVRGGYTTDGSGIPVHIYAHMVADYYLPPDLLLASEALVDLIEPNTNPDISVTVGDSDTPQLVIDQPADMAPWIGDGDITLSVYTEFEYWDDPPGIVFFGCGASVSYTITYDYTFNPLPLFSDGFESGDASAWSAVIGEALLPY